MSKITFTRQLESDAIDSSSAVDEVYYNENTRELYVDLDPGNVYKYSNVPDHVAVEFQNAKSAGSFYATVIKRNYGPGEDLGRWSTIENYDEVEVEKKAEFNTGGLVVGGGTVYVSPNTPLVVPAAPHIGQPAPQFPTFTLKPFADEVKVEGTERTYIVTFEVEGIVDFKRHTLKSTSVDEAVTTVRDLGKTLDLNFIVREVTIKFD